jgi:dipeptidyl-peptidase-4
LQSRYEQARRLIDPVSLLRNRTIEPRWAAGDVLRYRRLDEADREEWVEVDPLHPARAVIHPPAEPTGADTPGGLRSPDGRVEVFCRDDNLWARDLPGGQERALTTSGVPGYGWGALPDNCMVRIPLRAAASVVPPATTGFSPSGRYVFTARIDEREYGTWPFVQHVAAGPRPQLHEIRVALDGEDTKPVAEAVVIDLAGGATVPLELPVGAIGTITTIGVDALAWADDESRFWVLAHEGGDSVAELLEVDTSTGQARTVLSEIADPLYEPNQFLYSLPLVRVIPSLDAVVWYSQRSGWGQLYQYSLSTGELIRPLVSGPVTVRDILRVDVERRSLLVVAGSEAEGRNPYWRSLYRLSLSGEPMVELTPEPCDHEFAQPQPAFFRLIFSPEKEPVDSISPSGRYCVDHMSTVDSPPVIVLRDLDAGGGIVCELERTDISRLVEAGFTPPIPFHVPTADGSAEIWGALILPPEPVDPSSVPVIDLMYAGYQTAWQPSGFLGPGIGAHSTAPGLAYATLGFATVILDGRGTPGRSREFRQWTHAQPDERRGLEDHVHAIQLLGRTYRQLDLDRVGVTGFSYGGYNSTRSILLFPEFFKVAVSGAGVHVPERMPKGAWRWHAGAHVDRSSDLYRHLGNLHLVDRLQGRLLLTFGEMDENATMDHSLALAAALIAAGKRFDMKMWPNANHYTQSDPYMVRTAWDYFVEHLLGERLPAQETRS